MSQMDVMAGPESRGLYFRINGPEGSWRVLMTPDFLDDSVGDGTTEQQRREWVEKNIAEIVRAAEAKIKGGFHNRRFEGIVVEEEH